MSGAPETDATWPRDNLEHVRHHLLMAAQGLNLALPEPGVHWNVHLSGTGASCRVTLAVQRLDPIRDASGTIIGHRPSAIAGLQAGVQPAP